MEEPAVRVGVARVAAAVEPTRGAARIKVAGAAAEAASTAAISATAFSIKERAVRKPAPAKARTRAAGAEDGAHTEKRRMAKRPRVAEAEGRLVAVASARRPKR